MAIGTGPLGRIISCSHSGPVEASKRSKTRFIWSTESAEKNVCCYHVNADFVVRPCSAKSPSGRRVSSVPLEDRQEIFGEPVAASPASSSSFTSLSNTSSLQTPACSADMENSVPLSLSRGIRSARSGSKSCSCSHSTSTRNISNPSSLGNKYSGTPYNLGHLRNRCRRGATVDSGSLYYWIARLIPLALLTLLLFIQHATADVGPGQDESQIVENDGGQQSGVEKGHGAGDGPTREAPLPLARHKPTPSRENFTDAASDLLDCVEQLAFTMQHPELSRVHLVACLLEMPGDTTVPDAINEAGGQANALRRDMHAILIRMPQAEAALAYGEASARPELRHVVLQAWRRAEEKKQRLVGVQELIAALLECDRFTARMKQSGTNTELFLKLVTEAYRSHTAVYDGIQEKKKPEWLETLGVRLTDLARENKLGEVLERDEEIAEMQAILSRMTKPNCMLVGEPGVGKTALVEGLANLIVQGRVCDGLLDTEIYSLNVGSLVAGSAMRGDFEKRMKVLLEYITASKRRSILFVDEIHLLMGAGKSDGPMDAANLLKPALARGQIRVIGATTLTEYRRHVEKDLAFARRFVVLEVKEPSEKKAISTLKGLRSGVEKHHGMTITDEALEAAVRLSSRYIRDRNLPDKAIDLIDSACSMKKVRIQRQRQLEAELLESASENDDLPPPAKKPKLVNEITTQPKKTSVSLEEPPPRDDDTLITSEDVAYVISSQTGVEVQALTESDRQKLLRLSSTLRSRVFGQDEAIDAVANAVLRSRAGLSQRKSPVGTFLFLGPPGVGKTELAKALAVALFADKDALIRLDMSEFSEAHTASRLIGSPPGFMNHDEGGQLTEAVRARPYSVVLLDELENAHSRVFPYLLQVLGEGRLTDSRGVVVDFKNCVVIATSNIGAKQIVEAYEKAGGSDGIEHKSLGHFDKENEQLVLSSKFGNGEVKQDHATDSSRRFMRSILEKQKRKRDYKDSIRKEIEEEAGKHFRPQVVNRFKVVLFDPLDNNKLRQIFKAQEKELAQLFREQHIDFALDDSATALLVKQALDKSSDARDFQRFFEEYISNPLSVWILSGRLRAGMKLLITTSRIHTYTLAAQVRPKDFESANVDIYRT